jgi:hypothetical protein
VPEASVLEGAGVDADVDADVDAGVDDAIPLAPLTVGDYPPPEMDLAPGVDPSPAFPDGTAYVGRYEDDGVRVTEWDLARKVAVHTARLPLEGTYANVRLLRTEHALHAVAWAFNADAAYVQLTGDLHVVTSRRVGAVSVTGPTGFASDGRFTIVVGSEERGVYAASFDDEGRVVGNTLLQRAGPPAAGLGDAAVVLDGHAYVLLRGPSDSRLALMKLDTRLHVERRTTVAAPEVYADDARAPALDTLGVTLSPWNGALRVDTLGAATTVLVSTELEARRVAALSPVPSREAGHDVWLGAEHVTLTYGARRGSSQAIAIHWTPESATPHATADGGDR